MRAAVCASGTTTWSSPWSDDFFDADFFLFFLFFEAGAGGGAPGTMRMLGVVGEADMMCVSATPVGALEAEWKEHGLAPYVALIVGQEIASKKDALRAAVSSGYAPGNALMIGDAPGDMKAAHASGALFFPIVPGDEEGRLEP